MMSMIGLGVLPFGLILGSVVPLWWFARALADALSIPRDAPVIDQPLGLLWLILFLLSMGAFALAGVWLGLFLVVAILRRCLGWTWEDITGSFFNPGRFRAAMWGLNDSALDLPGPRSGNDPMFDPSFDEGITPPAAAKFGENS